MSRKFPTLEAVKSDFEVGSTGKFLARFSAIGTIGKGTGMDKVIDLFNNLKLGDSKNQKVLASTAVSYEYQNHMYHEISFGMHKLPVVIGSAYPENINLEYLEDSEDSINKAILEWSSLLPQNKTGRATRDLKPFAMQLTVSHYDKGSTGELELISKDGFTVTIPKTLPKSNSQGTAIKTGSLEFELIGVRYY